MSGRGLSTDVFYPLLPTAKHQGMNNEYDEISKLVNDEIALLGDDAKFADLKPIDKKFHLTRGTSFDAGGYADYFAFMDEED